MPHRWPWKQRKPPRVFVLGLDGVPYSLLMRLAEQGVIPHLAALLKTGQTVPIHSVLPPISSVAWASFMTARNPGKHGIFGFVDRQPSSMQLFLPTSAHLKAEPLWEAIGRTGKRVLVMNCPVTYPPRPVNGILVSGFEAPSLDKAVYPADLVPKLRSWGYQTDANPRLGHRDLEAMMLALRRVLKARFFTLFQLIAQESWDFVFCHVMETDRLHHFFWGPYAHEDRVFGAEFLRFYVELDALIGSLLAAIPDETELILLSDHGFTELRTEFYLNTWLRESGWFVTAPDGARGDGLSLGAGTRAYSLVPGRVYLNLRGRERDGIIELKDYAAARAELTDVLRAAKDPETGAAVIAQVLTREEAFTGPHLDLAPDLVVLPVDGFDLKGSHPQGQLTGRGAISGMHTYGDAFFFARGRRIVGNDLSVMDPAATVCDLFQLDPGDRDGRNAVK